MEIENQELSDEEIDDSFAKQYQENKDIQSRIDELSRAIEESGDIVEKITKGRFNGVF